MKFLEELENIKLENLNKKICIIIGDPVNHSLSPAMHNNAYKSIDVDNKFVFDKLTVKKEELQEFIEDLKNFNDKNQNIIGITCTMPHKENITQYLDDLKNEAKVIKAVNTVLFDGEKYIGYNTDWYGIERPFIEQDIELNEKNVAIIGAGGASRASLYAFKKNTCNINIFNRTKEKADLLAKEFNCNSYNLNNLEELKNCDIIINTTSVGMGNLINLSPINTNILHKNHIIFECIYNPKKTKLVQEAEKVGAAIIYGWEMLLYQGVKQFKIYTKKSPKIDSMKKILL